MDIAVKRGFAIGFVVLAGLAGGYGCQPQIERGLMALRGGEKPATLAGPATPSTTPADPKASGATPSESKAPEVKVPDMKSADAATPSAPATPGSPKAEASTPGAATPLAPATPQAPAEAAPPIPGVRADATTPAPADATAQDSTAQDSTNGGPAEGGAFDIVRVEPSGEMVIAGRCAADCSAELTANGKTHDAVKADKQGQWAMTPAPLPPGDYQLGLRTRTPDGKQETSSQTLTVVIPTPPSKDVVVVLNAPDAPSKILQQPEAKVADAEGGQPASRSTAQPGVQPGAPGAAAAVTTLGMSGGSSAASAPLAIGAIEAEDGRVFAQGTGPAGALLRLYLNNAPIATATIGADGRWSLRVEQGLTPGAYSVRADQLDPAGAKVVGRVETGFTYTPQVAAVEAPATPSAETAETAAPAAAAPPPAPSSSASSAPAAAPQSSVSSEPAPAADTPAVTTPSAPTASSNVAAAPSPANAVVSSIDTAQVRRGDSLWRISRTTYGRGVRYTEIYQANGGQIRDPDLIYPGQVLVLPSAEAELPTRPARP